MAAKKGKILIDVNDIVGKRIGKLEVQLYTGSYYSHTLGGERMRHVYSCLCDCGAYKTFQRGQLKNETVQSCGCIRRGKCHVD